MDPLATPPVVHSVNGDDVEELLRSLNVSINAGVPSAPRTLGTGMLPGMDAQHHASAFALPSIYRSSDGSSSHVDSTVNTAVPYQKGSWTGK